MDSSHSIRQLLHRRLVLLTSALLGALTALAAFLAATPWLNQVSSDRLLPGLFRVLLLWGLIAFMLATGAALLDRLRQHRNLRGLDLSQTKADLLAQAESVGLNGTLVLSGHHLLNLTDLSGMDLRQATALTLWFLPGDRDAWLFARKDRAPWFHCHSPEHHSGKTVRGGHWNSSWRPSGGAIRSFNRNQTGRHLVRIQSGR